MVGAGVIGIASSADAGIITINLASAGSNSVDIRGPNAGGNNINNFFGLNTGDLYVYDNRGGKTGLYGVSGMYIATGTTSVSPTQFINGALIGPGANFQADLNKSAFKFGSNNSPAFGPNTFIGLRSFIAPGTNVLYGWAEVTWDPGTGIFQILSAAYESTPNTPIAAGDTGGGAAVPEPATTAVAALLMGGTALRQWRKKRRSESSSETLAS